MSTMLGKRKRAVAAATPVAKKEKKQVIEQEDSEGEIEDAQAIFRRHFEAHFKPLPAVKTVKVVEEEESEPESDAPESGEESDWDGISEADDDIRIEVIEHTAATPSRPAMSKSELKAFMSSKVPAATSGSTSSTSSTALTPLPDADDLTESANLKKDLALQRLLSESHLLDLNSTSSLSGANRHKATDLRLQALGSKKSILVQEKMPMSHRRGIVAKANEREDKRRVEARENGIILERIKGKAAAPGKKERRERGVGAPAVGKFEGGTLRLSKKDVYDIEGPKKSSSGRGGKGGRGGRGGKRGRGRG